MREYEVIKPHVGHDRGTVLRQAGKEVTLLVKSMTSTQVVGLYTYDSKGKVKQLGYRIIKNRNIFNIFFAKFAKCDIIKLEEQLKELTSEMIPLSKEFPEKRNSPYISSIERLLIRGNIIVPVHTIKTLSQLNHILEVCKQEVVTDFEFHNLVGYNSEILYKTLLHSKVVEYAMSSSDPILDAYKYIEVNEYDLCKNYSKFHQRLTPLHAKELYEEIIRGAKHEKS